MNAAEILKIGRARIEQGWIKGSYARLPSGDECKSTDAGAHCCALGAIGRDVVLGENTESFVAELIMENELSKCWIAGLYSVGAFNDLKETTKADVLTLFDMAVARAEHDGAL